MSTDIDTDHRLHMLADENQQLRRAVEELSVLNDLARTIGGAGNSEEIIHTVIRKGIRAVGAEQGVVTLVSDNDLDAMKTYVRTGLAGEVDHRFRFTTALLGWMHLNMKPLLISDPANDPRFAGIAWDGEVRSLLSVPMTVGGKLIAALTVFNSHSESGFTGEDQRLLAIIAAQSAQVVENARLQEKERELLGMRRELELASAIQRNLLPGSSPAIVGYDIAGSTRQAQMVGGDFFDFVRCADGRMAATLGDVCGKGLPASLLMSNVQAMLRTQSVGSVSPADCLTVANSLLFSSTATDKYVTLFYGLLDPACHTINYVNAGHTRPLVITAHGGSRRLEPRGLMLGLAEKFPFVSDESVLEEGEIMVIYSDGITEAVDLKGEEFGEEGLQELIVANRSRSAAEIIDAIIAAVESYCETSPQQDDMTLVIIKRN